MSSKSPFREDQVARLARSIQDGIVRMATDPAGADAVKVGRLMDERTQAMSDRMVRTAKARAVGRAPKKA